MAFVKSEKDRPSVIREFFSNELLKELYWHACRIDITDNNEKAEMILDILGDDFPEVGTGTNRIAVSHNGIVFKIGFDRRGFIDNLTEAKRAGEKSYFMKVYETNYLINACEYWTVMDEETFLMNEAGIKTILKDMSEDYIFNDLGFNVKNCYNWGYREIFNEDGLPDGEIGILDYGYVFPKIGQSRALSCPVCGSQLEYNSAYTGMKCQNTKCGNSYDIDDIYGRLDTKLDEWETKVYAKMNHIPIPHLTYKNRDTKKKEEK